MNRAIQFLVSLALVGSHTAHSDVWAEREALAAISSEISALEHLVVDAEAKKNDQRMTFRYDLLIRDLRKIQEGIDHHLQQPLDPINPSDIDPLVDSYSQKAK